MSELRDLWETNWRRRRGEAFLWYTGELPEQPRALLGSGIVPQGPALDIGCGDGVLTSHVASFRGPAIGMDFAVTAIRQAKVLHGGRAEAPFFVVAAVPRLPFDDGTFAFAFDRGCMHNLPPMTWKSYLADVDRVLQPGGAFELWYAGNVVRRARTDRLRTRLKQVLGKAKPRRLTAGGLRKLVPSELEIVESTRVPFVTNTGRPIVFDRFVLRKRRA